MAHRMAWDQWSAAFVLILAAGAGWPQTVPLAEQRTIVVDGQAKVITSKLSRLNPNTTRVRAVMNLNLTYGFTHRDGKPLIESMLNRLAAQEGWTVTHYHYQDPNHPNVDDRSKVTLAELNKNLVVFSNHVTNWGNLRNDGVNVAVETNIETYMKETGGGLVLMHGSGDSFNSKWDYYAKNLHPVNFQYAGNILPGTIFRPEEAAGHPVMEGGILSADKVINGEWYNFQKLITTMNPKAEVLMKVDPARCANCGLSGDKAFPGGNPISWVMPVDKGWVGYFGEGHDNTNLTQFTQEVWDRFFKQMMFYVAGYDTTSVPVSLPAYARDHSGISFDEVAMVVFIEKPGYHKVGLYDLGGRKYDESAGRGVAEYNFERTRKNLKPGVYTLRVDYGRSGTATKRYVLQK